MKNKNSLTIQALMQLPYIRILKLKKIIVMHYRSSSGEGQNFEQ